MRLKTFTANTMSEAMELVKNALGEDAIIVATNEDHGAVQLTAAIEPAFEVGSNGRGALNDDWLQYDEEEETAAVAEELTEVMLRHGVPEDIMDHIVSCATVAGLEKPSVALVAALEHIFHFRPLPQGKHDKPLIFVGPPGSGKTLAIAKAAARATMDGRRVSVITYDTVRAGGIEQLEAFTRLLNIDLKQATNPEDVPFMAEDLFGYDQILIDSPGTNPFNNEDLKTTARVISRGNFEPHLVMPSGIDSEESADIARSFSSIGVQSMITTRLDLSRRFGSILTAAHNGSFAFADASKTPQVADGFIEMSPKSLTGLLIPAAFNTLRTS